MQIKVAALLFSFFIMLASLPAGAAVIFNNFDDEDDSYDALAGSTVGSPGGFPSFQRASAFTATGSFHLDSIELGITRRLGTNLLNISFATDASGLPGAILETWQFSNAVPDSDITPRPLVLAASSARPLITSGDQYWLIASAPTPGSWLIWHNNDTGDFGPTADKRDADPWLSFEPYELRNAMRISGTAVAAIPEPSTYALMLAGLGIVVFAAKRRRRVRSAAR